MAFKGMDVDTVESIGHQLHTQGDQITHLVATVDGLIQQAEQHWSGKDALDFLGWWNNQHKPALNHAADAVRGLGQSALNNASAQRAVSEH